MIVSSMTGGLIPPWGKPLYSRRNMNWGVTPIATNPPIFAIPRHHQAGLALNTSQRKSPPYHSPPTHSEYIMGMPTKTTKTPTMIANPISKSGPSTIRNTVHSSSQRRNRTGRRSSRLTKRPPRPRGRRPGEHALIDPLDLAQQPAERTGKETKNPKVDARNDAAEEFHRCRDRR